MGHNHRLVASDNPAHACVGKSRHPLSLRFKKHLNFDKPMGVGGHYLVTGRSVSMSNIKVLSREPEWQRRKVKEAIHIKQQGLP